MTEFLQPVALDFYRREVDNQHFATLGRDCPEPLSFSTHRTVPRLTNSLEIETPKVKDIVCHG